MAYINGKKVVGNIVVKGGGGGGGDAELNLAYGLTPPSDTTKIWVKAENEPSKIKVEANRQLLISNDENAKQIIESLISNTKSEGRKTAKNMVKIGNNYYIIPTTQSNDYFMGNNLAGNKIYKWNGNELTELCALDIPTYTSGREYYFYNIWKYDDTHIIAIYYYYYVRSSTAYTYTQRVIVDITDGTYTTATHGGSVDTNIRFSYMSDYYDGKIYMYKTNSTNYTKLTFYIYDVALANFQKIDVTTSFNNASAIGIRPVFYNNYLYFSTTPTTSTSSSYSGKQSKIYKWEIGTENISEVCTLPSILVNSTLYAIIGGKQEKFGNKMIIFDTYYHLTSGNEGDYAYDNSVYFVDLDTGNIEYVNLSEKFGGAFACINDNTGNVELLGATKPNTWYNKKHIVTNIYELEENTLDLYYDPFATTNIKLLNTDTITMDAPINHAWLGDSNDIAQPVDFYYYKNSLWWGVNCLGYTQLSNCVISANDVAIDLANATSDTQTITITPTWNDQTGTYNISVASSDSTIATASLSGTSLTITGVATGSATITISVVDAYGTTFTKDITATIE